MTLTIAFRGMRGFECTLRASTDDGDAIIWWDAVDSDGAHVELSTADKWLALIDLHDAIKEAA